MDYQNGGHVSPVQIFYHFRGPGPEEGDEETASEWYLLRQHSKGEVFRKIGFLLLLLPEGYGGDRDLVDPADPVYPVPVIAGRGIFESVRFQKGHGITVYHGLGGSETDGVEFLHEIP